MIEAGSIIHGTMRREDLIPAFLDTLQDLAFSESKVESMAAREWNSIRGFMESTEAFNADGSINEDWFDTESADYTLEDLFDALDSIASCFDLTFGASEGDGSDYGFWSIA